MHSHIKEKEDSVSLNNFVKTIQNKDSSKIQITFQNMLKNKYNLFYRKATTGDLKPEDLSNINTFYMNSKHRQTKRKPFYNIIVCI